MFPELAFIRFSVADSSNNHVIAQRVVPLKRLCQGYRHLRMRNNQNQPLELSTLFIYSKQHVEQVQNNNSSSGVYSSSTDIASNFGLATGGGAISSAWPKVKHKQFKLTVYGLNGDEDDLNDLSNSNLKACVVSGNGVQVKVTQDTTVQQVIEQVRYLKSAFFQYFLLDLKKIELAMS